MSDQPTVDPDGYLDSASGMPLHPAAREVLLAALDHGYADPRRLHPPARRARLLLDNARAAIAESFAVRPDEVTFTPSGTHAVHAGLLGLAAGVRTPPGAAAGVVATAVEHSAVLQAGRWHATHGGRFTLAPVDSSGRLDLDRIEEHASDADVIACQLANHEVGTVQPVAAVAQRWQQPIFMDACAAGGWVEELPEGWAAAALSAHKWGGPAGVGVLLVRKGAAWRAPFPVDERDDSRSVGFENVPGALAAAAALRATAAEVAANRTRLWGLVDRIRAAAARLPDVDVVGDPARRLPHLVTFSCLYVDGEALVHELARRGYAVASGSACTASTLEPSHVLAAMGALTHGNVRISLLPETTEAEVERFVRELSEVVVQLRGEVGQ